MEKEITNIKLNMAELKTDIKYIKDGLIDNKNEHKEILDTFKEYVKVADKKYSGKWVENTVKIVGLFIITGVIGFLGTLLYQVLIHVNV